MSSILAGVSDTTAISLQPSGLGLAESHRRAPVDGQQPNPSVQEMTSLLPQ
jgi:hypothetical protein